MIGLDGTKTRFNHFSICHIIFGVGLVSYSTNQVKVKQSSDNKVVIKWRKA